MIQKLKKYLTPKSHRALKVEDTKKEAHFRLLLESIEVGQLSFNNNSWEFKYSDEFKKITGIKPLADFPDIDKTYNSTTLWPFFSSRIPSLSRSRVKNLIEKEGIPSNDLLALLERFGKRTITNPFVLETGS